MGTTVTPHEDRTMSIAGVFRRAGSTIVHNPVVVLGIALLLGTIASVLINYISESTFVRGSGDADRLSTVFRTTAAGWTVSLVIAAALQGTLTTATAADDGAHRATLGACLGAGIRALPSLIGVGLIYGVASLIGFILVIPGIIITAMWSVAAPVVVIERSGVLASLDRSRKLTSGAKWKILGLFLVLIFLFFLFVTLTTRIASSLGARDDHPFDVINLVASAITLTVLYLVYGTLQPSLYLELRQWKEG